MAGTAKRVPMWARKPGQEIWERTSGYWWDPTKGQTDPYEGYEQAQAGEKAIDVLGREVFVGDRIAVAVTAGRSANMRVGVVTAIRDIMEDRYVGEDGVREYKKVPSGRVSITCDWEASGWQGDVKASTVQAELPKYVKL